MPSDPRPEVTVITITRTRPTQLQRAMAAVQRQSPDIRLEHRILVDACPETEAMLRSADIAPNVIWRVVSRAPFEHSGPGRSSYLRNIGVAEAYGDWIAFIDDDNDWEAEHLETLLSLARAGDHPAVHSAMQMFHGDGRPYCEGRVPWSRDADEARAIYDALASLGVAQPGTNIFLDRADPPGTPGGAQSVDTGEWLIAKPVLERIPFRTTFSRADAEGLIGEDDKLMMDILQAGHRPQSTGRPTLKYFIGGYSNNFEHQFDASFSWETQHANHG